MQLRSYFYQGCTGQLIPPPAGEITFTIKREDEGPAPLLLQNALLQPSTATTPVKRLTVGKFIPITGKFSEVRGDIGPEKFQIHRSQIYGANPEWGIQEVYAEAEIGKVYNGEGISKEDYPAVLRLVVVWDSGEQAVLYEDFGRAKYSYRAPSLPETIIITDINHDGAADFLLDFILYESKDQNSLRQYSITYGAKYPIGGC